MSICENPTPAVRSVPLMVLLYFTVGAVYWLDVTKRRSSPTRTMPSGSPVSPSILVLETRVHVVELLSEKNRFTMSLPSVVLWDSGSLFPGRKLSLR